MTAGRGEEPATFGQYCLILGLLSMAALGVMVCAAFLWVTVFSHLRVAVWWVP